MNAIDSKKAAPTVDWSTPVIRVVIHNKKRMIPQSQGSANADLDSTSLKRRKQVCLTSIDKKWEKLNWVDEFIKFYIWEKILQVALKLTKFQTLPSLILSWFGLLSAINVAWGSRPMRTWSRKLKTRFLWKKLCRLCIYSLMSIIQKFLHSF